MGLKIIQEENRVSKKYLNKRQRSFLINFQINYLQLSEKICAVSGIRLVVVFSAKIIV